MHDEHDGGVVYVAVDFTKCCGYTACIDVCPEVFKLDAVGLAYAEDDVVPPGLENKARRAAAGCPTSAIYVGPTRYGPAE